MNIWKLAFFSMCSEADLLTRIRMVIMVESHFSGSDHLVSPPPSKSCPNRVRAVMMVKGSLAEIEGFNFPLMKPDKK